MQAKTLPDPSEWYEAMRTLYQELDAEIAAASESIVGAEGKLCVLRGICCDFRVAEHQLFATQLEVDYAIATEGLPAASTDERLCPFWRDGLCQGRHGRPVGCRTYFCDPRWREIGEAIHERFHARVAALATAHERPYGYGPFVGLVDARRPDGVDRDGADS